MAKDKNNAKRAADAAKTAKEKAVPMTVEAPAVIVEKTPEYVTVALNHPWGLKFKVVDKFGVEQTVIINGNATGLRGLEKGVLPGAGAFGITPNVPAELWDAIKAKYQHMAIFRNGLIFATSDASGAKSEAKNRVELRSGFEAVEPEHTTTNEE